LHKDPLLQEVLSLANGSEVGHTGISKKGQEDCVDNEKHNLKVGFYEMMSGTCCFISQSEIP